MEQHLHQPRRRHAAAQLDHEQQHPADPGDGTDQHHPDRDGRVEQAAADAEEDPCVGGEGEAEGEGDVEQLGGVLLLHGRDDGVARVRVGGDVGDLRAGEGEEEEGDGADQFADDGDGVAAHRGG